MQREFYRSRNMPLEHSMLLTGPDPLAATHELPRLPNIQKMITQQIAAHCQTKQKQMHYKKNYDSALKQSQQILAQLQKCQSKLKKTQKKYQQIIKEKDVKIFMLFCEIDRLSNLNSQVIKESDQLHHQNSNIINHYNSQLKKFQFQLQRKSQDELRAIKQQFSECIGEMKTKYSQRLALLMGKDQEEVVRIQEYKEIIRIMELEVELVNKQRESVEGEMQYLREEFKDKIKVLQGEVAKKSQKNLELTMRNNELQLENNFVNEKYRKVLELNGYLEEKQGRKEELGESKSRLGDLRGEDGRQNQAGNKQSSQRVPEQPSPLRSVYFEQEIQKKSLQIQSLHSEIQQLSEKLEQESQSHQQEVRTLEQSIVQLNLLITKLQSQNTALEQNNSKLTILVNQVRRTSEQAITGKQVQIKEYKIKLEEVENEMEILEKQHKEMKIELEEYKTKDKTYMEILDMKSSRQISADIDQIRRDNEDLIAQVERLERNLEEKEAEISRLNEMFERQEDPKLQPFAKLGGDQGEEFPGQEQEEKSIVREEEQVNETQTTMNENDCL